MSTRDIRGGYAGWVPEKDRTRSEFYHTNFVGDIPGAQADTLPRFRSERQVDPLNPRYVLLDATTYVVFFVYPFLYIFVSFLVFIFLFYLLVLLCLVHCCAGIRVQTHRLPSAQLPPPPLRPHHLTRADHVVLPPQPPQHQQQHLLRRPQQKRQHHLELVLVWSHR